MKAALFALVGSALSLAAQQPKWELVWADEFDYTGLPDATKWTYEVGFVRNQERQYYTWARKKNARVENGHLIIEAHKEKFPNPGYKKGSKSGPNARENAEYTAASLITLRKASWRYGRIEVRAKLPKGKGSWPAIWMLGVNHTKVGYPFCGEIDIMEFVAHSPDVILGTMHFPNDKGKHKLSGGRLKTTAPADDFHIYAIEWNEKRIDFFFDKEKYFSFPLDKANVGKDNPFRKPFYLLINYAVGGTWVPDVDPTAFPSKYLIDYVRVYEAK
ncbi:MAG: glycoside hydrolase family 16 protein [Victivallales bacterium]|jgi:beta-glucanase (GH16 family)|nr:glycoside hydrolase family 16 protein [Victivallales bacterium]